MRSSTCSQRVREREREREREPERKRERESEKEKTVMCVSQICCSKLVPVKQSERKKALKVK